MSSILNIFQVPGTHAPHGAPVPKVTTAPLFLQVTTTPVPFLSLAPGNPVQGVTPETPLYPVLGAIQGVGLVDMVDMVDRVDVVETGMDTGQSQDPVVCPDVAVIMGVENFKLEHVVSCFSLNT